MDLTNKRFGRLVAKYRTVDKVYKNGKYTTKQATWHCVCDCGKEKDIVEQSLINKRTRSCGCLRNPLYNENYDEERKNRYHIKGNKYDLTSKPYGIGYCSNTNKEFYFDLEDYNKIKNYTWYEQKASYHSLGGFIVASAYGGYKKKQKLIFLANLVLDRIDVKDNLLIDYIHQEAKNDCRKSNLRVCETPKHTWNNRKRKDNSTGVTGVSYNNTEKRYIARITVNKEVIYLCSSKDINVAIKARKEAEEKYFGEYSYDNSQKVKLN